MELVVRKNDLLRELQLFQGIVERKNTIPILANVLMEASGDEVRFLATDLEVGLRSKCAATVAKAGALTLPAKKLYEIVKSLPDTDIRIAQDIDPGMPCDTHLMQNHIRQCLIPSVSDSSDPIGAHAAPKRWLYGERDPCAVRRGYLGCEHAAAPRPG